ncbi:MAG: SDR family NAD(P)-dependent oxidoreductase [Armatimonadota bacterium]
MEIRGRTALVTGGAVRVGKAIALELARRGMHVGITYRSSAAEAESTVEELRALGVQAHAERCELRSPEEIERAVRGIEAALGPVDVLVNSASMFERTPLAEASLDDWDAHLETNLRAPWLLARAVGPGMAARGEGVIVNILDVAAERPFKDYTPYSASKAGLASVTMGLARDLAPHVRVNAVAPGAVLWGKHANEEYRRSVLAKTPLGRVGSAEDVARAVAFLAESGDFMTGSTITVDGGRRLV